jgi:hypothetical protein
MIVGTLHDLELVLNPGRLPWDEPRRLTPEVRGWSTRFEDAWHCLCTLTSKLLYNWHLNWLSLCPSIERDSPDYPYYHNWLTYDWAQKDLLIELTEVRSLEEAVDFLKLELDARQGPGVRAGPEQKSFLEGNTPAPDSSATSPQPSVPASEERLPTSLPGGSRPARKRPPAVPAAGERPPVKPSEARAYQSFAYALEQDSSLKGAMFKAVHMWLQENENPFYPADELPDFETWVRYVRAARWKRGEAPRNKPRAGRTGRSITQADRL